MRDVGSVFAPRPQVCASCGRESVTAARGCPHCGTPYVMVAQRLSRRAKRRIAVAAALFLAAAFTAGILASPAIEADKDARARAEAERLRALEARERVRLARDQRPVTAEAGRMARPALVAKLGDFVLRDARARAEQGALDGPIRRAYCEPHPNTATRRAQESDPRRRRGRYLCIAVTSEIRASNGRRGNLGYPFSAVIDYRRGRITWCKANPPPGEQVIGRELARVDLDASCSKA